MGFDLTPNSDMPEWTEGFPIRIFGATTIDRLRHGPFKFVLGGNSHAQLTPFQKNKMPPLKNEKNSPQNNPEWRWGFSRVVSNGPYELGPFGGDFAQPFKIMDSRIKPFPTGYYSQTALEGAIELLRKLKSVEEIEEVTVYTFDPGAKGMAGGHSQPPGGQDKEGRKTLDPGFHHKGHPKNPMSDQEAEQKIRNLYRGVVASAKVDEILDQIRNLEKVKDLGKFVERFTFSKFETIAKS